MTNMKKILAVADPTQKQQPGVERAAMLAKSMGAELELFTCYYNEHLSGERFFDSRSLENARREVIEHHQENLELLAKPIRDQGVDVTTQAIWDHPLYEGIVRAAVNGNADLVVKDTHHHSALERALLTNTDWNLIRTCPVPLWLVKSNTIAQQPSVIAAIDPMNQHDKPAALDDEILSLSKSIAASIGGDVRAFHCYDPRVAIASATANAYIPVSLPLDEIEQQMQEDHRERFEEITKFHGIDADKTHLISGLTHEELPALAKAVKADVVVMGAVARNRWKRLFVGATAERTLEHLPCDLLIVKPDWFSSPVESNSHESE